MLFFLYFRIPLPHLTNQVSRSCHCQTPDLVLSICMSSAHTHTLMYALFIRVPQTPVSCPSAWRRPPGWPRAPCRPSAPGVMRTGTTSSSSAGMRLSGAGVWTRAAFRLLILWPRVLFSAPVWAEYCGIDEKNYPKMTFITILSYFKCTQLWC